MPTKNDQGAVIHHELQLVFVGGHVGCVDALQVRTGELVHRLTGLADAVTGIATDGESLVAAADVAGNVAVWNCRSGRRLWRALLPCTPSIIAILPSVEADRFTGRAGRRSSPTGTVDMLFVASKSSVYGIDMHIGAIEWKYGRDIDDVGAPGFVALDVKQASEVLVLLRDDSQVVGIDVACGRLVWRMDMPGSPAALTGHAQVRCLNEGRALLSDGLGRIALLDNTGSRSAVGCKWSTAIGGRSSGTPLLPEGPRHGFQAGITRLVRHQRGNTQDRSKIDAPILVHRGQGMWAVDVESGTSTQLTESTDASLRSDEPWVAAAVFDSPTSNDGSLVQLIAGLTAKGRVLFRRQTARTLSAVGGMQLFEGRGSMVPAQASLTACSGAAWSLATFHDGEQGAWDEGVPRFRGASWDSSSAASAASGSSGAASNAAVEAKPVGSRTGRPVSAMTSDSMSGTVYCGHSDGSISAFSQRSPVPLWTHRGPGSVGGIESAGSSHRSASAGERTARRSSFEMQGPFGFKGTAKEIEPNQQAILAALVPSGAAARPGQVLLSSDDAAFSLTGEITALEYMPTGGGSLLAVGSQGGVSCLDAVTGGERWTLEHNDIAMAVFGGRHEALSGATAATVRSSTIGTVFISMLAVPSTQPVVLAIDMATGTIDWSHAGSPNLKGILRVDAGIALDEASGQLLVCGSTHVDGSGSVLLCLDSSNGRIKHTVDLQFSAGPDSLRISKRYGRLVVYDCTSRRIVAMPLELSDGDVQFLWQLKASLAAADESAVAESVRAPKRRASDYQAQAGEAAAGTAGAGGIKRRRAPRLGALGASVSSRGGAFQSSRSVASTVISGLDMIDIKGRYMQCSIEVDDSQGVAVCLLGTTGVVVSVDLIAGAVVGREVVTGDEGIKGSSMSRKSQHVGRDDEDTGTIPLLVASNGVVAVAQASSLRLFRSRDLEEALALPVETGCTVSGLQHFGSASIYQACGLGGRVCLRMQGTLPPGGGEEPINLKALAMEKARSGRSLSQSRRSLSFRQMGNYQTLATDGVSGPLPQAAGSSGILVIGSAGEIKRIMLPELLGPMKIVTDNDVSDQVLCGGSVSAETVASAETPCCFGLSRLAAMWRPYAGAIFAAFLLIFEWCQMAGLAISTAAVSPTLQYTSVGLLEATFFGMEDKTFWMPVAVVATLVILIVVPAFFKEQLARFYIANPMSGFANTARVLADSFALASATILITPIAGVLASAIDCTELDDGELHWDRDLSVVCVKDTEHRIAAGIALVLGLLWFSVMLRLVRVGGRLDRLRITGNPFSWTKDDTLSASRNTHLLGVRGASRWHLAALVVKIIGTAMVTLFGARRPLLAALVVLVLDIAMMGVGVRYPPFPTPIANHFRFGFDAALVWIQLVGVVAASLRPQGMESERDITPALDYVLGTLPLLGLLPFFGGIYLANAGWLDGFREQEKRVSLHLGGDDLFQGVSSGGIVVDSSRQIIGASAPAGVARLAAQGSRRSLGSLA